MSTRPRQSEYVNAACRVNPSDKLGFKLGSPAHPFLGHYHTEVCKACYLPACISDDDYAEIMRLAGYAAPCHSYCPIMWRVDCGLSLEQVQSITSACLHFGHGPNKATLMVEQCRERNDLLAVLMET